MKTERIALVAYERPMASSPGDGSDRFTLHFKSDFSAEMGPAVAAGSLKACYAALRLYQLTESILEHT